MTGWTQRFWYRGFSASHALEQAALDIYGQPGSLVGAVDPSLPVLALEDPTPAPPAILAVTSATSTAATIAVPSSVMAGDLLVLMDRAENSLGGGLPATVVPTGFTSAINTPQFDERQIISAKLADGSDAGSTLTGMDGTSADAKLLLVFRRFPAATSISIQDPAGQATDGNPTAQTINASGGNAPLVALAGYSSYGAVSPRTMTPAKQSEISISTRYFLAWKIYDSSPADVSADMDDEGLGNFLQSLYIEMIAAETDDGRVIDGWIDLGAADNIPGLAEAELSIVDDAPVVAVDDIYGLDAGDVDQAGPPEIAGEAFDGQTREDAVDLVQLAIEAPSGDQIEGAFDGPPADLEVLIDDFRVALGLGEKEEFDFLSLADPVLIESDAAPGAYVPGFWGQEQHGDFWRRQQEEAAKAFARNLRPVPQPIELQPQLLEIPMEAQFANEDEEIWLILAAA